MSRVTIKAKRQKSEENIALKVMERNSEKSWEFILFPSPSLSLSLLTQALKSTRTEAPQLPGLTYLREELQRHTPSLRCLQHVCLYFANLVGSLSDSNLGQSLSSSQLSFLLFVKTVFLCVVLDVLKFVL